MFQLTAEESSSLRSQIATLKTRRGRHRKYLPYVFTEHGAIMAATILNSPRAIEMSFYDEAIAAILYRKDQGSGRHHGATPG